MSKATPEQMQRIHGKLADTFEKILESGETVVGKDAEGASIAIKTTPAPATLGQIRQFLRDNGIEADLTKRKLGQSLAAVLPFAGSEQEAS